MNSPTPALRRRGFTLVELLVVIAIIAVLMVLGFVGISMALKRAQAARDTSTMRQVWLGINMYAGDNNDYMPGPLFTRQNAIYNEPVKSNYREWRRLSDCLAPYLGIESPKKGDFVQGMAASWQKDKESGSAPAYYMQQKLVIGDGPAYQNPWGKPAPASYEERLPMKLRTVLAQPEADRTWAFTEMDQLHPAITDPELKNGCPKGMAHGTYRLAIFFNGSVAKVDVNNNPM